MSDQNKLDQVLETLGVSKMKKHVLSSRVTIFEEEKLVSLDLSDLDITLLPSGVFDTLTNLSRLYLNNNEISNIDESFFAKMTGLTFLSLFANRVATLPNGVFTHLPNLEWLDLRKNSLGNIPLSLVNLDKLVYLYLQNNPELTMDEFDFNQDYHSKRDVSKFVESYRKMTGTETEKPETKKAAKKSPTKKAAAKKAAKKEESKPASDQPEEPAK